MMKYNFGTFCAVLVVVLSTGAAIVDYLFNVDDLNGLHLVTIVFILIILILVFLAAFLMFLDMWGYLFNK